MIVALAGPGMAPILPDSILDILDPPIFDVISIQGGAGKTSLWKSLCNEPFDENEPTTEVADTFSISTSSAIRWKRLSKCPDLYREQLRRLLSPTFIQEASDIMIDEDDVAMQEEDTSMISQLRGEMVMSTGGGTATDTTSSIVFNAWDFGGQELYYALHHVFIHSNAIYLVVFNLEDAYNPDLRPDVLRNLVHWLNSIHTYSGPKPHKPSIHDAEENVILVGTHRDRLPAQDIDQALMDIDTALDSAFSRLAWYSRLCFLQDSIGSRLFFAVSNKFSADDRELPCLRQAITDTATSIPSIRQPRPVRWMKLNDELRVWKRKGNAAGNKRLRDDDGSSQQMSRDVFNYGEALDAAMQLSQGWKSIFEEPELRVMLRFLNDIGEVIYIDDLVPAAEQPDNLVVLSFSWLIGMVRAILVRKDLRRDKKMPKEYQQAHPSKTQADWAAMWEDLCNHGKLHEDLLVFRLWEGMPQATTTTAMRLLDRLDIVCLVSPGQYLVPSVPLYYSTDRKNRPYHPHQSMGSSNAPLAVFGLGDFLPEGLFSRLLIQVARHGACTMLSIQYRTAKLAIALPAAGRPLSIQLTADPERARITLTRGEGSQALPEEVAEAAFVIHDLLVVVCKRWYARAKLALQVPCPQDLDHLFDVHNHILGNSLPPWVVTKNGVEVDTACLVGAWNKVAAVRGLVGKPSDPFSSYYSLEVSALYPRART